MWFIRVWNILNHALSYLIYSTQSSAAAIRCEKAMWLIRVRNVDLENVWNLNPPNPTTRSCQIWIQSYPIFYSFLYIHMHTYIHKYTYIYIYIKDRGSLQLEYSKVYPHENTWGKGKEFPIWTPQHWPTRQRRLKSSTLILGCVGEKNYFCTELDHIYN